MLANSKIGRLLRAQALNEQLMKSVFDKQPPPHGCTEIPTNNQCPCSTQSISISGSFL